MKEFIDYIQPKFKTDLRINQQNFTVILMHTCELDMSICPKNKDGQPLTLWEYYIKEIVMPFVPNRDISIVQGKNMPHIAIERIEWHDTKRIFLVTTRSYYQKYIQNESQYKIVTEELQQHGWVRLNIPTENEDEQHELGG